MSEKKQPSYQAFYESEKKWVSFYPLDELDQVDDRPSEQVLNKTHIYGQALIGVCGYQPIWMHHQFPKHQVRIKPVKK